jgi:hypothetical protein
MNVNVFVPDRSGLQPFIVPERLPERLHERSMDGLKRLQNHVYASKTKETL